MGADAGELGAIVSQGHDDGTGCAAAIRRSPNSDEFAVLGIPDPTGTDENVTDVRPQAHFGATDPRGCGDGPWRVSAAGKTEDASAVANVEYIDADRVVSRATAAPHVPPLLAEPLQERNVL